MLPTLVVSLGILILLAGRRRKAPQIPRRDAAPPTLLRLTTRRLSTHPRPSELDMSSAQARSKIAIETRERGESNEARDRRHPCFGRRSRQALLRQPGWRLDADFVRGDEFRVVQFTPPGSPCSIIFGKGITSAVPGSAQGLDLIVSDIEAARAELVDRGVEVSEPFHDVGGVFHHAGREGRLSGPERRGELRLVRLVQRSGRQGWLFQEVTVRLPGRVNADDTTFASSTELATALRRAEAAHGEHEKRTGQRDADWPDW